MRGGVRCIIPDCPGLTAARGRLFCPEHLALLPWEMQERLHALRKGWRPRSLGRALASGLPEPEGWEKAAHRRVYPEAPSMPAHPYTRWYMAAFGCTFLVLVRIWEGVFIMPQAEPSHARPYESCPCPLCSTARAVALKALERRG